MKKVIYAVFLRSTGLVKAVKLEEQKTVTASCYTIHWLPQILQDVNVREHMLHHDNAASHSARLTLEFLEQEQIKVLEHPPYFPDLAMCDFWLFFNLKQITWTSFSFRRRDLCDYKCIFFIDSKK